MGKVFSGSIMGKEIVNIDGTVLGELENVIFEVQTGKLVDLAVKPDSGLNRSKYREDGKLVLDTLQLCGCRQGLYRCGREPGHEGIKLISSRV